MAKLDKDATGYAKLMIAEMTPPFSIPNMSHTKGGKHEKCPPSQRKDRDIQATYKYSFSFTWNIERDNAS